MDSYVTGNTIRALREKKGYTQKQLADLIAVSDKTVSKWETLRGLPDISLLEPLAAALGIPLAALFSSTRTARPTSCAAGSTFAPCAATQSGPWASVRRRAAA